MILKDVIYVVMSDAQKKGNERYQKSKCIRISLILNKEDGIELINYLNRTQQSKNGFIVQAIKEKIKKDTGRPMDEFLKEESQD